MASRVFVLVTAKTCGGCVAFKTKPNGLNMLTQKANTYPGVKTIHIDLPNTGITSGSKSREYCDSYHPDLHRWITRFPSFYVFNQSWFDHNVNLEGRIYLARMENGKPVPTSRSYAYSTEEVLSWLDSVLNNSTLGNYKHTGQRTADRVPTSMPKTSPAKLSIQPQPNSAPSRPRPPILTSPPDPLTPLPSAPLVSTLDGSKRIVSSYNDSSNSRKVTPREIIYGFAIPESAYPDSAVSW